MIRPTRLAAPAVLLALVAVGACHRQKPVVTTTTTTHTDTTVRTATIDSTEIRRREAERRAAEEAARRNAEAARAAGAAARNTMAEKVYFDFDSDALSDRARATLDAKLAIMQANPGLRIRIEGNCDSRGSDEYNLALGQRRAVAAKRYLTDRGIDPSRIDVISYGEERPVVEGENEDAWAQNRRDEFVITAGGDNIVAPRAP